MASTFAGHRNSLPVARRNRHAARSVRADEGTFDREVAAQVDRRDAEVATLDGRGRLRDPPFESVRAIVRGHAAVERCDRLEVPPVTGSLDALKVLQDEIRRDDDAVTDVRRLRTGPRRTAVLIRTEVVDRKPVVEDDLRGSMGLPCVSPERRGTRDDGDLATRRGAIHARDRPVTCRSHDHAAEALQNLVVCQHVACRHAIDLGHGDRFLCAFRRIPLIDSTGAHGSRTINVLDVPLHPNERADRRHLVGADHENRVRTALQRHFSTGAGRLNEVCALLGVRCDESFDGDIPATLTGVDLRYTDDLVRGERGLDADRTDADRRDHGNTDEER
ncbi:hypothetical protein F8O01_02830 [Pseudoclavibacter chungangensis]|uniref:Uncharacterized protein n=1 Tax=Pseudoclavibacter chungangensis TaxID=587635 RepID=A0A7J5C075_9MICO|nr:hypothetical protein [Pseudoclavibacter chungangensis]KAB1660280.1 hypothetical protein F8O01_02830 [Pseudoclavibacter chungangensis]NYJ65628.1 hypothetical protein [Pseudoclavibacter chungangensis]